MKIVETTPENFSYELIPTDTSVVIPINQQMRTYLELRIQGEVTVSGSLLIFNG